MCIISAPKGNEINSPIRNAGNVVFPPQDLASPISQASQTSSSSISLNGPPSEAPPPLPPQHSQEEKEGDGQEEASEDPFASAPFSLPSGFRRASQKANRR